MVEQKLLITGSAGFIGYHLSNELLTTGHEIIGIDNLNDYYDQNLKVARLNQLGFNFDALDSIDFIKYKSEKNDNLTFLRLDICDTQSVESLFKNEKIDIVVNLAAQAGVRYSIENPSAYVNTNIIGFHNLIENSNRFKIKHFNVI